MPIDLPDDIELELVDGDAGPDVLSAARGAPVGGAIEVSFGGELWYWRGPAPYHFIKVPPDGARRIHAIAAAVTYGWGMIPAEVRIGDSRWTTALWPKDGGYVIPIKDQYRKAERLVLGETVAVGLTVKR